MNCGCAVVVSRLEEARAPGPCATAASGLDSPENYFPYAGPAAAGVAGSLRPWEHNIGKISLPAGTTWPLGLGRAPVDVGVGLGGGGVHLQRHEVKEEVGGLMDVGDRGEKRKVEDFSTLYSLDHGPTAAATPSHGPTTPPRSLPEQTGEKFTCHYTGETTFCCFARGRGIIIFICGVVPCGKDGAGSAGRITTHHEVPCIVVTLHLYYWFNVIFCFQ